MCGKSVTHECNKTIAYLSSSSAIFDKIGNGNNHGNNKSRYYHLKQKRTQRSAVLSNFCVPDHRYTEMDTVV